MLKWFHNSAISTVLAILLEIVIHALFALGALPLGSFLGDLALHDLLPVKADAFIGGYGLAATIFLLAMYAFVYAEYSKEHIGAFEKKKGDGSYIRSWTELRYIVAGAELSSLVFRCFTIQGTDTVSWVQRVVLFAFGLLMLRMAYDLGKVIHAIANRPVETIMAKTMQDVGRDLVKDAADQVRYMTPSQKTRFYRGDMSVLDELQRDAWSREDSEQENERERARHEREDNERAERAALHILRGDDVAFPTGADSNQSEVTRRRA